MSESSGNENLKNWDRVYSGFHLLTFDEAIDEEWGSIVDGAVAIAGGKIAWVGRQQDLPEANGVERVTGHGEFLSPGLIDCHTHLVYGGSRADEWQQRLQGVSYEEIARAGGGILSTVKATRAASEDELFESAKQRAEHFVAQGVTTIEIKSGYGLDVENEMKMLRAANRLEKELPLTIHPTLLGAHAVPPEFKDDADGYVDLVVKEMIPAAKRLATSVDIFTENIAFNLQQTETILSVAHHEGFGKKIHAEQLSNMGGAKLAAELGAMSADHLEYLDEAGVQAMAKYGTVATLLPGAFYFLKETQKPSVELLRKYNVPIAIATDANPGSSPVANILLMANMACTYFGLTPAEAIRGMTISAAKALAVEKEVGSLAVGKAADIACWDIVSPAELAFAIGHNPCKWTMKNGVQSVPSASQERSR